MSRLLSTFEAWGADARGAALCFFGCSLEEIESILRRASPDVELRYNLALLVWTYALDVAGKTGDDPIRPADTNRHLARLAKQMRQLRETLLEPKAVEAILMLGIDALALVDQIDDALLSHANIKLGTDKGGRLGDSKYSAFMHSVTDLYRWATGDLPTLTTDSVTGIYRGDFFRLAELIDAAASLATGQPAKTNGVLGERLATIIKQGGKPR